MKAFVSWSGGKDGMLALYRAVRAGIEASLLLNMTDPDGLRSRSHGVTAEILRAQAEALGVPIVQPRATWDDYETVYKQALREIVSTGVRVGIFGDIDFPPHREWTERVCGECGVEPLLPLWGAPRELLLGELIQSGFRAVVCSADTRKLDASWVGRTIDESFVADMKALPGVDISGEGGEYHTLVVSGPLFRKRLLLVRTEPYAQGSHVRLEILEYRLEAIT